MASLGCDFGSSAIKLVLIDDHGNLLGSVYERNQGIIPSTFRSLSRLPRLPVTRVGCTGSGRSLGAMLVGGDFVATEIIAHFRGTTQVFPGVRTVFEIGGEDCKLIQGRAGRIESFQMNALCGGGTGSLIETISGRLGIPVEEFGRLALQSRRSVSLAGKCGVFAQSSVVNRMNQGYSVPDIAMGVARALVNNYFALLVRSRSLSPPFAFQGATALNPSLHRAFEEILRNRVDIPPSPHLTGAIGVALLAASMGTGAPTAFRGWDDLLPDRFVVDNVTLTGCANRCEVVRITDAGGTSRSFGQRCDRCLPVAEHSVEASGPPL